MNLAAHGVAGEVARACLSAQLVAHCQMAALF